MKKSRELNKALASQEPLRLYSDSPDEHPHCPTPTPLFCSPTPSPPALHCEEPLHKSTAASDLRDA